MAEEQTTPVEETKPDQETAPPADTGSEADAPKGQTEPAPESDQQYEIRFPDGADAEASKQFTELFKTSDVKPEVAQKIIDAWAEQNSKAEKALDEQVQKWEAEVKSIADHEKLLAAGKRAVDFIGDESFTELVEKTWFGSHPAVVKALARLGDLLGDDAQIEGARTTNAGEKSLADRLFGSN